MHSPSIGSMSFYNDILTSSEPSEPTFNHFDTDRIGDRIQLAGGLILSCTLDMFKLKPCRRIFKAITKPITTPGGSIGSKLVRIGIGIPAAILISVGAIALIALTLLLPSTSLKLKLHSLWRSCFFIYKTAQTKTLSMEDFNHSRGALNLFLKRASANNHVSLSTEYVFSRVSAFLQEHEEQSQAMDGANTGLIQDNSIQTNPILNQSRAGNFHTIGSAALIDSLAATHREYVEKEWFSQDEVSLMGPAYYAGLHTAAARFVLYNFFSVGGSAAVIFQGRQYMLQKEHLYAPYSKLCYPESISILKHISEEMASLKEFLYKQLGRQVDNTILLQYLSAFFLHQGDGDRMRLFPDEEELRRQKNREQALANTLLYQVVHENTNWTAAVRELEQSISLFSSSFFEKMISSTEWNGKNQAAIDAAFFYDRAELV